jgi:hypothetical protein
MERVSPEHCIQGIFISSVADGVLQLADRWSAGDGILVLQSLQCAETATDHDAIPAGRRLRTSRTAHLH